MLRASQCLPELFDIRRMKLSVVLSGLLWLSVATHDLENFLVDCSEFWLQVKVRRIPFIDMLQPQHYELYLGTGCSVNRILPDFFEFMYPLSSCGIKKYDQIWGTIIKSSISYEPVILNFRGYVPIVCSIKRNFRFTFVKKEVENNGSYSGEITQGLLEDSTFSQEKNLGIQPGSLLKNVSSAGLFFSFSLKWMN